MMFWTLWWIDAVVALVFVYFFIAGLSGGSVSSFNMTLWVGILAGRVGLFWGSHAFQASGRASLAQSLLMFGAIPGVIVGFFFLALLIIRPRWN